MRLRPSIAEFVALLAIAGLLADFGYDEWRARSGARDGLNDAEIDIAASHVRWMLGGKPNSRRDAIVARLLRERYGVEMTRVYDCCPTPYLSAYEHAYNDSVEPHILKTFPSFSIHDLFDEARREWLASISK